VLQIREVIDRDYMVEGDLRGDEHQTAYGSRVLPWVETSSRPPGSRAAHPHQRPHTQRPGKADCGQEKVRSPELKKAALESAVSRGAP
jgi:hypothetical protein